MQAARGASLKPSDPADPPPEPFRAAGPRTRSLALFGVVALLGYLLDLSTKVLAVTRLTDGPVPLVGDILTLRLVRNPGAAFSTGTSYTFVLSLVAIAAAVVVLWAARRLRSTGWALGLGFLLAGVLGNLTDRIFRAPAPLRGHVVDFLQLPNWPIFNVADICINLAAVLIIVQALRGVTVDGSRSRRHGADDDPAAAS